MKRSSKLRWILYRSSVVFLFLTIWIGIQIQSMDSDPQSSLLPVLNWFGPGSTTLILRQIDIPVLYIWNYSVMYLWLARNTKDWISANLVQFLHKISCLTSWEIDAGRPRYARRLATGSLCKITLVGPTLYSRGGWISLNLQSWARKNSVATMCSCFQSTKLFVITILLYLLWLPHLDTEA